MWFKHNQPFPKTCFFIDCLSILTSKLGWIFVEMSGSVMFFPASIFASICYHTFNGKWFPKSEIDMMLAANPKDYNIIIDLSQK